MNIVTDLNEWQTIRSQLAAKTIGLVHTMGNLHAGHMSLCARSLAENEITVACIFINPTQFNDQKDFELYPRTLEHDQNLLRQNNIDYLLLPNAEDLYPDQFELQIQETKLATELEGQYRPGHFIGMLTVVLKVLNLVQPTHAYYGEKDFQQLLLIQKMAQALFLTSQIVACPTIRDIDGLALSSRNSRLNKEQRQLAAHFPRLLKSSLTPDGIAQELSHLGFKVDYIVDRWQRRLGAVWLDKVRLIDNVNWFALY